MFGTVGKVTADEGVTALWKGVNAAWLREASYTSLRLGLYEPTKVLFGAHDPATATFLGKFMAGSAAGALGSLAGNPFDGTYMPTLFAYVVVTCRKYGH
jgi:solute carrier family 25 protein 14/30